MAAEGDDAPGDRHALAGVGAGAEIVEALVDLGGGVVAVEADRVRLDAALPHRVELGEPVGPFLLQETGGFARALGPFVVPALLLVRSQGFLPSAFQRLRAAL